MTDWQPIDTAPNSILLVTDGAGVFIGMQNSGRWFTGHHAVDPEGLGVRFQADLFGLTHWMQIPDLPPPKEPQ